jgi:hypothetical protein
VLAVNDGSIDKEMIVHAQRRLFGDNVFNMPHPVWLPRRRTLQPLFHEAARGNVRESRGPRRREHGGGLGAGGGGGSGFRVAPADAMGDRALGLRPGSRRAGRGAGIAHPADSAVRDQPRDCTRACSGWRARSGACQAPEVDGSDPRRDRRGNRRGSGRPRA